MNISGEVSALTTVKQANAGHCGAVYVHFTSAQSIAQLRALLSVDQPASVSP